MGVLAGNETFATVATTSEAGGETGESREGEHTGGMMRKAERRRRVTAHIARDILTTKHKITRISLMAR